MVFGRIIKSTISDKINNAIANLYPKKVNGSASVVPKRAAGKPVAQSKTKITGENFTIKFVDLDTRAYSVNLKIYLK